MFWHYSKGLITSHTEAEFDDLNDGEGYTRISYGQCVALGEWMAEGKTWASFPQFPVSRPHAAEIFIQYMANFNEEK